MKNPTAICFSVCCALNLVGAFMAPNKLEQHYHMVMQALYLILIYLCREEA
jgi:hypothetical protein